MYTVFILALSVGDFPGKSSVAARIRSIYRRLGCYNQKGLVDKYMTECKQRVGE